MHSKGRFARGQPCHRLSHKSIRTKRENGSHFKILDDNTSAREPNVLATSNCLRNQSLAPWVGFEPTASRLTAECSGMRPRCWAGDLRGSIARPCLVANASELSVYLRSECRNPVRCFRLAPKMLQNESD